MNVMDSNISLFISNSQMSLLRVDGSARHLLELAGPQQQSSHLLFVLNGPHSHQKVAVNAKQLVRPFNDKFSHYFRLS